MVLNLKRFLVERFDKSHLRMFADDHFATMVSEVNWDGGMKEVVSSFVSRLRRSGRVAELWEPLALELPRFEPKIRELQAGWTEPDHRPDGNVDEILAKVSRDVFIADQGQLQVLADALEYLESSYDLTGNQHVELRRLQRMLESASQPKPSWWGRTPSEIRRIAAIATALTLLMTMFVAWRVLFPQPDGPHTSVDAGVNNGPDAGGLGDAPPHVRDTQVLDVPDAAIDAGIDAPDASVLTIKGLKIYTKDYSGKFDEVHFAKGASVRVLNGSTFALRAKRILVPSEGVTIDASGEPAAASMPGDPCPNCCGGGCREWRAGTEADYQSANGDCSRDLNHADNGRTRAGSPGSSGANITIQGTVSGGSLRCKCTAGPGGTGGVRGPGKIHLRPKGNDPWECPGGEHRNDVGAPGAPGLAGRCRCP